MDAWTPVCMRSRTIVFLKSWTPELLAPGNHGLMGWPPGLMDSWSGLMDSWTPGHRESWTHGRMDTWAHGLGTPGILNSWIPGCMDSWTHGPMGCPPGLLDS